MFITLTVDTTIKKKKLLKAKSWRKAINVKKRSLWQRMKSWRRSVKVGRFPLEEQTALF